MKIIQYLKDRIGAFVAWLLTCGLALVVIAMGAPLFQVFMVTTLGAGQWSIRMWIQLYYVLFGFLWLGFFILMEHLLFSESAREGLLWPRTGYVMGLEFVAMALIELVWLFYNPIDGLEWLILLGSALIGSGLIWISRRKPH